MATPAGAVRHGPLARSLAAVDLAVLPPRKRRGGVVRGVGEKAGIGGLDVCKPTPQARGDAVARKSSALGDRKALCRPGPAARV